MATFRGGWEARFEQWPAARDPQQFLDERLVRGEIDVDEDHARQDALRTAP